MHWSTMAATDFFTVEVWTGFGLVRYHVLFVIRLMTREVYIAGIVPEPEENWMQQTARNLTDASEGFLRGSGYLIHDRSTLFTEKFRTILKSAGVEPLRLPARSPNLNAFAERFVRSIKESCLDRLVLIGGSSLHRAVSEFVLHYHKERNHQGLDNRSSHRRDRPLSVKTGRHAPLLSPRSRMKTRSSEFSDSTGSQAPKLPVQP